MAKRDIIIACFSIPAQKAGRDLLATANWEGNAPYVWQFPDDPSVEGSIRSGGFKKSAMKLVAEAKAAGGVGVMAYLLNKIVKESKGQVADIGRVAIVTFSAGNSAARFLMTHPADQQLIDSFVSLDSTTVQLDGNGVPVVSDAQAQGWYQYAAYGISSFDASSLSVYLSTNAPGTTPDIMPTRACASLIFDELRRVRKSMDEVRDTSIPSPLDFNPTYPLELLNNSPRLWATGGEQVLVEERIGNNFRLYLPNIALGPKCKAYGIPGQGECSHIACANDFQLGIVNAILAPRWRNPDKFVCLGPDCIRPFNPYPPLSGFGAYTETVIVPTTREINMAALTAEWDRMGLFRWDLFNKGLVVGGAAAVAAAVSYFFLKD